MKKRKADLDSRTPAKTKPTPAPSGFTAESMMRDIQRAIEGKKFENAEELNEYFASISGHSMLHDVETLTPREEAQELAFDAMEARSTAQARKLAKRALDKDPDCIDAMVVLIDIETRTLSEAIAGLQKAVATGERLLGPDFFAQNKGYFWGILETRPYMRARQDLAQCLRDAGLDLDAIAHYEAMLELNPNDNQGMRYPLLGLYLKLGKLEGARKLLRKYRGDGMPVFEWARPLERFLSGDLKGAAAKLRIARNQNSFVGLYICGQKQLPKQMPDSYTMGSEEEAIISFEELGTAWKAHPEATAWLFDQLYGTQPAKRSSKRPQ